MIVFFSTVFVLVQCEPGTLRGVSNLNSTKVGSGAVKNITCRVGMVDID